MDHKIEQNIACIPNIIDPPVEMYEANQQITIHEGEYILKTENEQIKIAGKIYFDWFPTIGAKFSGRIIDNKGRTNFILSFKNESDIEVESLNFGKAFIIRQNGDEIYGRIVGKAILGDKSINVTKIKFAIPNLREFFGEAVKAHENKNIRVCSNRMILENDEFIITIDKNVKYNEQLHLLEARGGYITLYGGELIAKKKRNIDYETLLDLLPCLSKFLSFLNGRRTAPLFFQGIHDEKVIWACFTGYIVDQYKAVKTWPQYHSIAGLNDLWKAFYSLWNDEGGKHKDFLNTAVHWYVEANSNTGFVEGAIIMTQTCLELLYNWLIIEKNKLLIGNDGENISAANKLRLLISQIKGSTEAPNPFQELKSLIDTDKDIVDAVDAFVQIRNAIIHSHEGKRKKLENWSNPAKYESLQFSLRVVELALLYILGFKGQYYNRCSGANWAGGGEEMVPYL